MSTWNLGNKLFRVFTLLMFSCILLASCGGATITRVEPSATPQPTRLRPTKIPSTGSILTIGFGWQDPWVRNFNPFSASMIFVPRGCIYEPLMFYNSKTGELLPWLATGYVWGENNQSLTFTIRKGVEWSDGKAFSAEDVVATFKMLMDNPDINGIPGFPDDLSEWLNTHIAEISAPDAFTVRFRFNSLNTLWLYKLATEVIIVPKHIWGAIADPSDFTNPDPVGTGPFTEVTEFADTQAGFERILQLERNPHYWQEGKPYIQGVKFSFRHDENIIKDLAQGKLDWASIEIPDIQKDFLDKDPSYYQAILATGDVNLLQLNTAHPPFDNPDVRKAISMGIDRQKIIETLQQGVITPANAIGLGDRYKSWWNEDAIRAGAWVDYNVSGANTLLDNLGFKKRGDGIRMTPTGKPMEYTLMINQSDPNQDAVAKVISKNLADIGVTVSVTPTDHWWEAFTANNYDMILFSSSASAGYTPYDFYFNVMSPSGTLITGAKTNQDAGRYYSGEAGSLLSEFTQASDPVQQKLIMDKIQSIFVEDAPAIPLYPNSWFYEYNTRRFTGFPSAEDPYAEGTLGNILVLLNIRPR